MHLIYQGCVGGDSCCTPEDKCKEFEGDCDTDNECVAGLMCGIRNCVEDYDVGHEWQKDDGCCYDPKKVKGIIV